MAFPDRSTSRSKAVSSDKGKIPADNGSGVTGEQGSFGESSIRRDGDESDGDLEEKQRKEKMKQKLAAVARVLPGVAFALSIVWILLFPLVTITTGEAKPRGTFFDENAMLIHHTMVELQPSDVEWTQPQLLREAHPPQEGANGAAWVCGLLRNMDLPCYTHTFYEEPSTQSGLRESVYTVLEPAPGADGKECLVISTTQDLSAPAEQLLDGSTFVGLSVSLSILQQLKDHVGWMSKQVIVLMVDESSTGVEAEGLHVGVKAFVDDYHLDTLQLLERHHQDPTMTRSVRHSGVIRAAVSLDLHGSCLPGAAQLLTSGLNGELPNMDLLNSAVHHLERQGMDIMLDRCSTRHGHNGNHWSSCPDAVAYIESAVSRLIARETRVAFQDYLARLFAMLGFMGSVAMGPSGPHVHFLKHSVDALTIRGFAEEKEACTKSAARGTGAILSIVRGVSNLEEELHHSFFAYAMLSKKTFVSIGEYAYSLALLLVPLAMHAGRLPSIYKDGTLVRSTLIVGMFEAFGALMLLGASAEPEPSVDSLARYLQLASLAGYALMLTARFLLHGAKRSAEQVPEEQLSAWEGPKMVIACLMAYFCSVTALLSWPLAAALALTHVPMLAIARPFRAKCLTSWVVLPLMVMSLPACWPWLLGVATGGGYEGGISVVLQWIRWYRLAGLMNVPIVCLVSFPAHLTTAFILTSPGNAGKEKVVE